MYGTTIIVQQYRKDLVNLCLNQLLMLKLLRLPQYLLTLWPLLLRRLQQMLL
jgi:hypothetical protein